MIVVPAAFAADANAQANAASAAPTRASRRGRWRAVVVWGAISMVAVLGAREWRPDAARRRPPSQRGGPPDRCGVFPTPGPGCSASRQAEHARDRARPRGDAELRVRALEVLAHRAAADRQLARDLVVALAA